MYQTHNTGKGFAWHLINAQWKSAAIIFSCSITIIITNCNTIITNLIVWGMLSFFSWKWSSLLLTFCALSNGFEVWLIMSHEKYCQKFECHCTYTWINLSLLIHKLGIPLCLFSSFSQSESTFIIYSIKINTYLLYFFLATF